MGEGDPMSHFSKARKPDHPYLVCVGCLAGVNCHLLLHRSQHLLHLLNLQIHAEIGRCMNTPEAQCYLSFGQSSFFCMILLII